MKTELLHIFKGTLCNLLANDVSNKIKIIPVTCWAPKIVGFFFLTWVIKKGFGLGPNLFQCHMWVTFCVSFQQ